MGEPPHPAQFPIPSSKTPVVNPRLPISVCKTPAPHPVRPALGETTEMGAYCFFRETVNVEAVTSWISSLKNPKSAR